MGPFTTFQSQEHFTRTSLDKQKNEGHCDQQLCYLDEQENAGQFVKVSEKNLKLRTKRKLMKLPASNNIH